MNPVGTQLERLQQKRRQLRHHPRRMRVSLWISFGILGLAILFAVAARIALHTRAFHTYALNKFRTLASEQLGTQVDQQNFTVNLSRLSLDIYGLTIHGAAPYTEPP